MKRFSQLIFLILICSQSWALPFSYLKQLDLANKKYLSRNYEEALKNYRELINKSKSIRVKASEKSIIEEIKQSVTELELLLKVKQQLVNFSNAKSLEEQKKFHQASLAYFQLYQYLKKNKISDIIYGKEILSGKLEKFLLDQKKERIGKVSFTSLKEIEDDRKRRKSLVFLRFQRDRRVTYDLRDLVVQNLSNVLRSSRSFRVLKKRYRGSLNQQIRSAKKASIDFGLTGRYRKISSQTVELNFSVLDLYEGKVLVRAKIRMPLDFEFFDAINKIAAYLKRDLSNYSRLAKFAPVEYRKSKGGRLVRKQKASTSSRVEKFPVEKWVSDKVYKLELIHVRNLKNNKKIPLLKSHHQSGAAIIIFNKLKFPKKISYEEEIGVKRKAIKSAIYKKAEDLYPAMIHMQFSKDANDFHAYYDYYEEASEELNDIQEDYSGLKPVVQEMRNRLENSRKEVEIILGKIGKRIESRHGFRMSIYGIAGSKEAGDENYDTTSGSLNITEHYSLVDVSPGFHLGYIYDNRIYKNLWLSLGIGVGVRSASFKWESADIEKTITTGLLYIDLGLKYYLTSSFSIYSGLHSEIYFNDDEETKIYGEFKTSPPWWMFGVEYYFSKVFVDWLDISVGLFYGKSFGSQEFKLETKSFGDNTTNYNDYQLKYNAHMAQFSITGYYNSQDYNTPYPEYNRKGFWMSFLAQPVELKFPNIKNYGELNVKSMPTLGLGIAYDWYDGITINYDTYFFSSTFSEDGKKGSLKGIIQNLLLEVDLFKLWDFSISYGFGFGYAAFYSKNVTYEYFDSSMGGDVKDDVSGEVSTFNFKAYPILLGLKWQVFPDFRIKTFVLKSLEIGNLESFIYGGLRIELKI